jgi:hypothetical protein
MQALIEGYGVWYIVKGTEAKLYAALGAQQLKSNIGRSMKTRPRYCFVCLLKIA